MYRFFFISLFFTYLISDNQNYILDEDGFIIHEQEPGIINYELGLNNNSTQILDYYHRQVIDRLYKNKNDFFIYLKSNEKLKVLEIVDIDQNHIKVNILKGNLSKEMSFNNNISNSGNFYYQAIIPKHLKTIEINEILFIEAIDYKQDFKDIRNYTLFTIGTVWMLDFFF